MNTVKMVERMLVVGDPKVYTSILISMQLNFG